VSTYPRILIIVAGVVFAVIAYLGERLPQNAIVGIRTPATLSDERVWRLTHRRIRPVLALGAATCLVVGALGPSPVVLTITLLAYCSVLVVASLAVVHWAKSSRDVELRKKEQR